MVDVTLSASLSRSSGSPFLSASLIAEGVNSFNADQTQDNPDGFVELLARTQPLGPGPIRRILHDGRGL
jgi:hypothetical protein